ncbi:hypothetical protein ONA91_01210 [Micromonospora sp. DR5-3]|uniref:hypothetical protein n=1 Tax=unclassified Micromonospora TaxID=2617518 RepID=UPI0011D7F478|nr:MULTISPECIES: hypothetical protein [unclassified Micromonospora]MCW3813077.1 hypothetical protein [Micromonospora sp. DR5-3]TYC25939.1 hypothetical protein FXF52_00755 [Micromonospora sp. MP36]
MRRGRAVRAGVAAIAVAVLLTACGPEDVDPGTREAVDAAASAGVEPGVRPAGAGAIELVITGDLPRTELRGSISDTYGEHCRLGRTPPFVGGRGADVVKSKVASGGSPAVTLKVWSPRQAEAGELQGDPQVIVEVDLDTAFVAPLPAGAVDGSSLRLDLDLPGVQAYAGKTAHVVATVTCPTA